MWKRQSGGFIGRLIGSLLKTGFPLMKNTLKQLATSVLIPRGLTAAISPAFLGPHLTILDTLAWKPQLW